MSVSLPRNSLAFTYLSTMNEKASEVSVQKKLADITYVKPVDYQEENGDIYFSVKPFYMYLQLYGLQKIKFQKNNNTRTSGLVRSYSFLIAISILAVQCYCIYAKTFSDYTGMTSATVITDLLDTIPATVSCVVSLIMSATCNQGMILRVLNNFCVVDKKLAINKNNIYKPLRLKIVVVMVVLILESVFHYTYDYMFWSGGTKISVGFCISIVKELTLLEVTLLIYIDADRLDIMNNQLENLKSEAGKAFQEGVYSIKKKKEAIMVAFLDQINALQADGEEEEEYVDELTRLMRIYDRLVDNANIVNSCYGIQMLTASIAVFINILTTVNDLISVKKVENTELQYASSIFWCLRDLFFVTMAIISCERLQSKVKNTSDIINKLSINPKMDVNEQELLERFSQLIACRKTTMTACNFFPFDFTFIYSLVGAVATYTVILLQVNQGRALPTNNATTTMLLLENITTTTPMALKQ